MSTQGPDKSQDDTAPEASQDPAVEEGDRSQPSPYSDVSFVGSSRPGSASPGSASPGSPGGRRAIPRQHSAEDAEPRVSADPFSTFLKATIPVAGLAAAIGAATGPGAPVFATTVAGAALAALLQRMVQERATSRAAKEQAAQLDRKSVAILLFVADGQPHQIEEVTGSLKLSDRSEHEELRLLVDANLIEIASTDDALRLTPQGRSMLVQLSSEMAA
jgi:hypothetical protein